MDEGRDHYSALSHCWAFSQRITLAVANYAQHRDDFPQLASGDVPASSKDHPQVKIQNDLDLRNGSTEDMERLYLCGQGFFDGEDRTYWCSGVSGGFGGE